MILLCSIVNRYSAGQGPYCMPSNLQFVRPGFLFQCVQAAVSSGDLTDDGVMLAKAWMGQRT